MSQSPKSKPKVVREPPPSLFLGPPSNNASHVSLLGASPPAVTNASTLNPRAALLRQRSSRMPPRVNLDSGLDPERPTIRRQDSENKKQADRTDALWAEMQSTLEEVELTAVNGTHVFGPEHSKVLEELRTAQIGLAQAWVRSEADDAVDSADGKGMSSKIGGGLFGSDGKSALENAGTEAKGSTAASGSGSGAAEEIGNRLAEETEADIFWARKRREANDKYFQRVNGGVLEVVKKLEEVARAMRNVEQESRDIWDSESSGLSLATD